MSLSSNILSHVHRVLYFFMRFCPNFFNIAIWAFLLLTNRYYNSNILLRRITIVIHDMV